MLSNEIEEHLDELRSEPDLWNIFTRKEEYNPLFRDKYERFPYYLSTDRNIFEPKISKHLLESGLKIEYPDGKKFAVCLTHDIDALFYSRMSILTDVGRHILNDQLKDAFRRPFYNANKKWNPWWKFKEIMDLEEEFEAKSTFFIMGLKEGEWDFNYQAEDLTQELGIIVDRGWEVGLHGGHEAYKDLMALKRQKANLEETLGRKVMGYRNHFLRFKVPDTWELLKEAGFKYDTTFGYADSVGFRAGMCHPFRPFNLNTGKYVDLYEIPLTIMDSTLFDSYMRTDVSVAWDITKQLIDTARRYNGVINILWHNTYFNGKNLEFYAKILDYCNKKNAWLRSGESIHNLWTQP
ncbi:MAG TPA: hypothetical protein DDY59_06820 [Lachnospiraceae bacterium]|nr:hypothetical protein [Lachnospiraceae bacterium]